MPNTSSLLSAGFSFTTNENTTAVIQYGPTNTYGSSFSISPTLTSSHNGTISELGHCASYNYSITITDAAGNSYTKPDDLFMTNCNALGG